MGLGVMEFRGGRARAHLGRRRAARPAPFPLLPSPPPTPDPSAWEFHLASTTTLDTKQGPGAPGSQPVVVVMSATSTGRRPAVAAAADGRPPTMVALHVLRASTPPVALPSRV